MNLCSFLCSPTIHTPSLQSPKHRRGGGLTDRERHVVGLKAGIRRNRRGRKVVRKAGRGEKEQKRTTRKMERIYRCYSDLNLTFHVFPVMDFSGANMGGW